MVETQAGRSATGGAQAIRRAIDIVRLIAQIQRSGASLSRVARVSGLTTSTTFRILRSLTEERLLRYDHSDRCYYVGPLAFELGLAASAQAQSQMSWGNAVNRIARETRLTTYLMARSNRDAVCLLCVQGSMAVRAMPVEVGQRLPLGVGAGSLAILATLEDAEIQRIVFAREATPDEKEKAQGILKRVALARQRGFAISSGTVVPGVTGVGIAIQPQRGLAQLALSVSAVAISIDLREARKIASMISAAIRIHGAETVSSVIDGLDRPPGGEPQASGS
jgi:DNA-binding IclR family transcriptional regulator